MNYDEADRLYRQQQEAEEMAEQVKNMEKLEKAVNYRNAQRFMKWRDDTISDELRKAAEDFGLTEEDFQKHMADPNYERDLRKSARKLVEKAARRTGVSGRKPAQRERVESQRRGRAGLDLDAARAKAQRGQITEDEQLDILGRLLGGRLI
jgi:hypothetical protein